jgi:Fe-S-cluster containining protein
MSESLIQIASLPLKQNATAFSLSICESCKEPNCCEFEPPFLTESDLVTMERDLKLSRDQFAIARTDSRGHLFHQVRTSVKGRCMFYIEEKRKCGIYEHRPIDCKLFPLDIAVQEDDFVWITYQSCPIENALSENASNDMAQKAQETLLPLLLPHLMAYAEMNTQLYREKKWTLVGKTGVGVSEYPPGKTE